MTALRSMIKCLLFCLFALCAISGCKKSNNVSLDNGEEFKDVTLHVDMQYFDFDKVDNLSHYLDSVRKEHGIAVWDYEGSEILEKNVFKCIERIEGFRKGEYNCYPDSLVRTCINSLGHDYAALVNHGDSIDIGFAEWFLMLAAYYSPDITCLVDMQTPNHQAGILNLGSTYNNNPWWSYILLKRIKGFEVRRIGGDETKIDKLFQITDENNDIYYLCSNNSTMFDFLQVLFWVKDDKDVLLVAECDSLPVENWDSFEKCYYNPNQRAWFCCKRNNQSGKWMPISETPILTLKLDGEKSYFIK